MNSEKQFEPTEVDIVFVHRDQCILDAFVYAAVNRGKKVNICVNQQQFLAHVAQYSKDTKIVLGRTFHEGQPTGIQIAYHLHELGFKRLYLLTFLYTPKHQIPDFLNHISGENDFDVITRILDE